MKLVVVIAAVAVVFLASGAPRAGTVGGGAPSFTLDVTSSTGDELHLSPTLALAPSGLYVANVGASTASFNFSWLSDLNPDPSITGSFSITNLSGSTQTFTVSATLGVAPLGGPTSMSGYSGDITYTDASQNSVVTLISALFYQARIDGAGVMSLGSFDATASDAPGIQGTIERQLWGPETGLGVSSSIGVAFPGFSLTAGDSVGADFQFTVAAVPEPSFASLFAVAGAVFLARTARRARD